MTTITSSGAAFSSQDSRVKATIAPSVPRASIQDGEYPRPQLLRRDWADLDGIWDFRHDDHDEGTAGGWHKQEEWSSTTPGIQDIVVPFPPESAASGIAETGFHPIVWYRRILTYTDLDEAGYQPADGKISSRRSRVLLHFGAVDYRCSVWLDGIFLGEHEGGHTPFSFDLTNIVREKSVKLASGEGVHLVVRAEDDPNDVDQPRGKQDWQLEPHSIWYHRTTGIWQTVWLEAVPQTSIKAVQWLPNLEGACVHAIVELQGAVSPEMSVSIVIHNDGAILGSVSTQTRTSMSRVDVTINLPIQRNGQGYEDLLWSPDHPRLLDATVELLHDEHAIDNITSYLGLRSVEVVGEQFLLNDRPFFVRSVLNQGYWPESHLAAPSRAALRREVELIQELGFNATRVHQKIEDPRFLYWADRLGLLVWAETPGAFAFSNRGVKLLMREWMDAVERDLSHPSIVTWVPVNESWGVQHIAHDPAQQAFARALVEVTRALDPSRPVISNDGWEHQNSDIITIHDYEADEGKLGATYADTDAKKRLLSGFGPAGRRVMLVPNEDDSRPVMLTEFGGIQFSADEDADIAAWGYSRAQSSSDFQERFTRLLAAVNKSAFLVGFCYTQLTDTRQEANGLLTERREPKIPFGIIRSAIQGMSTATD